MTSETHRTITVNHQSDPDVTLLTQDLGDSYVSLMGFEDNPLTPAFSQVFVHASKESVLRAEGSDLGTSCLASIGTSRVLVTFFHPDKAALVALLRDAADRLEASVRRADDMAS